MAIIAAKESAGQQTTPLETQDKLRYIRLLQKKVDIPQPTARTKFNTLPNISLTEQELSQGIYYGIESLAYEAIEEGDYNRLKALLGPEIYALHQTTNQNIHLLRWSLIDTLILTSACAQLFNTVLWYARIPICAATISEVYYNSEEQLQNEVSAWQPLDNYFKDFHEESKQQGMTTRESLLAFERKILADYSHEKLNNLYKNAANGPIPILNAKNVSLLKSALIECLNALPQTCAETINAIVTQNFDDTIKNAIIHHIQSNVFLKTEIQTTLNAKINDIFKKTSNLGNILNQFYQLWKQSADRVTQIQNEYCKLIDVNQQREKEALLENNYRNLPEVQTLSNANILDIKDIIADILDSKLGKTSLSKLHTPLLSLAIKLCKRTDLSKSGQANRIDIAALLIRHSCSPFSLPGYSLEDTKQSYLAWPLIIETLKSIVCITPAAISIRAACLDYAKENHSLNVIALHRRQSVMRLAELLHQSQCSKNLSEDQLLQSIKKQIKHAPRGFLGRSSLYEKLEKIINNIESYQLIAINNGDIEEPSDKSKAIKVTTENTKFKSQDNTLLNDYTDECFNLVSLEEYNKSLQQQKQSLEDFYTQLNAHYALPTNQILSDFALIALKHRIDRFQFDLKMLSNASYDRDFWAPLFFMPELFGNDFSKGISHDTVLEKRNVSIFLHRNNPLNLLKRVKDSTIADSYTRFVNNQHRISGPEAVPYIYLHQCEQRLKFSIKRDISHWNSNNVLGRVEWSILTDMIQEHQKAIHNSWNKTPNQLAYFHETANFGKGLWFVNQNAAEPLMIRMQRIANFFTMSNHPAISKSMQQSRSKAYLQLLKKHIINPLYAEMSRLTQQIKCDSQHEQKLAHYNMIIDSIENTLKEVLIKHFKHIENKTLTDEINTVLSLDSPAAKKNIADLQARTFNDNQLLITLHHQLSLLLHRWHDTKNNEHCVQFFNTLKMQYFKALNVNFIEIMKKEFILFKNDVLNQVKNETNTDNTLKTSVNDMLQQLRSIENKKSETYGQLTENMYVIGKIIKNPHRKQAGQELCKYAPKLHGHASWRWKTTGSVVMIAGISLFILAILCGISGGIPALALGSLAICTLITTGANLFATGAVFFALGLQQGFSNSVETLGETLQKTCVARP